MNRVPVLTLALAWGCSAPVANPMAQLENDTGVSWIVVQPSPNVTYLQPKRPPAPILVDGKTADAAAMEFFRRHAAIFRMRDPDAELALVRVAGPGAFGATHAVFAQHVGAASVEGARLAMHFDGRGRIAYVTTLYVPGLQGVNVAPAINSATALALARADMLARFPSGALRDPEAPADRPELTLLHGDPPALGYRMLVSFTLPESSMETPDPDAPPLRQAMVYAVDARSGAILDARDAAEEDLSYVATGRGVRWYAVGDASDVKQIEVSQGTLGLIAGYYSMERLVSPAHNEMTARTAFSPTLIRSPSLSPWAALDPNPGADVDAFSNLAKVEEYWETVHHRYSYDGLGAPIKIVLNEPDLLARGAAWWDNIDSLHFAANPGRYGWELTTAAALDGCGHEFAHAVVNRTIGGLLFLALPEARSLNESLADCFGEFVENYFAPDPRNNSLYGEGRCPRGTCQPIDLAHPSQSWFPDHMDSYDHDTSDPHRNGYIATNAWYLLTVGGTNDHSGVQVTNPIGWAASRDLYYSVLAAAPPIFTFREFALAMMGQASLMPGADDRMAGPVHAVGCAWYAVGVFSRDDVEGWDVHCDASDAGTSPIDAGGSGGDASMGGDAGDPSTCDPAAYPGNCPNCQCCSGKWCPPAYPIPASWQDVIPPGPCCPPRDGQPYACAAGYTCCATDHFQNGCCSEGQTCGEHGCAWPPTTCPTPDGMTVTVVGDCRGGCCPTSTSICCPGHSHCETTGCKWDVPDAGP